MNIQINKMPLVDGKTYYLPVIFESSMEPLTEGGGCFSTPGGHCLMLNKESVRKLRVEVGKTYRCKDCKHAEPSPCNARNVYCEFQHPSCSWDKMCKACKHFELRKE